MYLDSVRFAISAKYTNDLGASPKMRIGTPIEVEEHRGDTQKEEHRGYRQAKDSVLRQRLEQIRPQGINASS
jgi:hypothetical protein